MEFHRQAGVAHRNEGLIDEGEGEPAGKWSKKACADRQRTRMQSRLLVPTFEHQIGAQNPKRHQRHCDAQDSRQTGSQGGAGERRDPWLQPGRAIRVLAPEERTVITAAKRMITKADAPSAPWALWRRSWIQN